MAVSNTPRFSLPQWSAGTDPYPGRTGFNNILALLENQAALAFPSGPIAGRPRSGAFGRFFLATDQGDGGRLYYDGGSGWVELNTNGGGGAGRPVVIEGNASEGSSNRSARSDHTHNIPLATANNHGAMTSQHYEILAGIAVQAQASQVPRRTSSGNLVVPATPGGENDATSKNYVDNVAGTSSLVGGTLVRRYDNGNFRAGLAERDDDVTTIRYLNSVTSATAIAAEGKIMRRWASGVGCNVIDPDGPQATSNKRYVDSRTSRRAWKENPRPLPYGLEEIEYLAAKALLYDYKNTEEAPLSVRGEKDHLGAYVEDVAKIMPLLVVDGEDGAPERITDREMIWPVIRSIGELAEQGRQKDARIAALVSENATLNDRLHRIEGYLGL